MMVLLVIAIMVVVLALLVGGLLLWVQRHPLFIAGKMRAGQTEKPGNLSYPVNYGEYEAKVEKIADLAYPSALPGNEYDLYLPRAAAGEKAVCPLVLWVHGGSFISGDKAGVENLSVMLAAEGYAVLAPNYAVAPENAYPGAVVQMNALCAHLPEVAGAYLQVDLSRIVFAGDSAGAQIIGQTAAVETNPALAAQMGLQKQLAPGALQGAMLCCGPYDLPALSHAKSLRLRYLLSVWGRAYFGAGGWQNSQAAAQTVLPHWVTEHYPPTYLTDGNSVSFEVQARRLGQALRGKGVPVVERYFGADEGEIPHEYQFLLAQPQAQSAYQDMLAFLEKTMAGSGHIS